MSASDLVPIGTPAIESAGERSRVPCLPVGMASQVYLAGIESPSLNVSLVSLKKGCVILFIVVDEVAFALDKPSSVRGGGLCRNSTTNTTTNVMKMRSVSNTETPRMASVYSRIPVCAPPSLAIQVICGRLSDGTIVCVY